MGTENVRDGYVSKLIQYGFFILSLSVASFVVKINVHQYLEGSTYMSDSKKPMTKNDLPTVTICLWASRKLEYGTDFKIQAIQNYKNRSENTTLLDLKVGRNDFVFRQKGTTYLRQLTVVQNAAIAIRSCIAMDLMVQEEIKWLEDAGGGIRHQLTSFMISLSEKIAPKDVTKSVLYFTTKQNSYGAVYHRWFDGETDSLEMEKGGYQFVKINKIARYQYLKNTCNEMSFYECVGSRLNTSRKCQEKDQQCTPFSLPNLKSLTDYPICQTEQVLTTCKDYSEVAHSECLNKKTCIVQEYSFEIDPLWSVKEGNDKLLQEALRRFLTDRLVDTFVKDLGNKYIIWVNIASPKSARGKFTKRVEIDVHKEYWALTVISLIGNIGGQLGLCVGFSFTGFVAWMLGSFPDAWDKMRSI